MVQLLRSGIFFGLKGRSAFAVTGGIRILNIEAYIARIFLIVYNATIKISLTGSVDIDFGTLLPNNSVVGTW